MRLSAADLEELLLLEELDRRRALAPLAYATLWDRAAPRTSQRRALLPILEPDVLMHAILGGNRTGKSEVGAMYAVALAAGRDAEIDGRRWVEGWLRRNGLPMELIPLGPGRVWVGSPTFGSAVEQIRPKLLRYSPAGTKSKSWEDKQAEGELRLPGGGVIVSKAYRQYDQDPQSWEGASPRGIVLDEQPNQRANLTAALARLVDRGGKILNLLTPLKGKADWYYREIYQPCPSWVRFAFLHGLDNPHIDQRARALMIAATPAWQRASRDVGAFTTAEGMIYPFDRGSHVIPSTTPPSSWVRWHATDWGGRAPHMIWAAESPAGELIVYRELAPRRTTQEPAITVRQLLELAADLERAEGYGGQVYRVADSEDPGAIVEAAGMGWWVEGAKKGPGSVVQGIELVEAMLQTVHPIELTPQRPRILITQDCPQLIEELEGMRWATVREGQDPRPDPVCPDHGPDALRYLVQYRQALGFR